MSTPTRWRLAVEHMTAHEYEGEVLASYNEARITPRDTPQQLVLDHRVDVRPATAVMSYLDYWGTDVAAFDVHEPHDRLVVSGRSLVETGGPHAPRHVATWDEVRAADFRDRFHELLAPSSYVTDDPVFGDLAREIAGELDVVDAVTAVVDWVRTNITYERGATTVATTATESLLLGRGVCQDHVHVALALLHAVGIPARYASGYLHPQTDAVLGEVVVGESHAWLEAWVGDWQPFDPTNGAAVAERHVLVARGRDYGDVTPFKGVYHGPPCSGVEVRVAITRLS